MKIVRLDKTLTDIRQLLLTAGLPDLPLVWRWHRLRFWRFTARTPFRRLRQEVQTRVCSLPGSACVYLGRRTVQRGPFNTQHN